MRLTLRTLLAYLDDSLDAPEAEELGRKIEESEFARALVHRMRSATRRLRLGAPKLGGKGMGLDPNTVAEYLDYTLAPDRVPDFEQVCLESDVHLAEVAACHQILTNVLGGVADVDSRLRDKIVSLGEDKPHHEAAHTGESQENAAVSGTDGDVAADAGVATDPVTSSPPYPRQSRPLNWTAVTVVAVLLLVAALLLVMGPLDDRHPLFGRFLATNAPSTVAPKDKTEAQGEASGKPRDAELAGAADADGQAAQPSVTTTDDASGVPAKPEGLKEQSQPAKPVANNEPQPTNDSDNQNVADKADSKPVPPAETKPDAAAKPGTAQTTGQPETPPKAVRPSPMVMPPSRVVAKLTSANSVVGRFDTEEETYFRVPALATIDQGDRLYAPPLFRPQLLLTDESGLQLTLVGPTRLELPPDAAAETKRFKLLSGRVIFTRHGERLPAWEFEFAGRTFHVEMQAPATTVAVETFFAAPVGEDPASSPRWQAVRLVAADGPVQVSCEGKAAVTVDANQELWQLDDLPAVVHDVPQLPDWVEDKPLGALDRSAVDEIEQLLALGRPMLLALHEAAAHRRVEVRSLAVESLAGAGEFWPFVDALSDRKLKSYWQRELRAVEQAIISSPEFARRLAEVLSQRRSDEGQQLYRILWGYINAQLEEGADRELVTYLEQEAVDLRVAAFEQLRRILGVTYLYRPDRTPKSQRSSIHKWREAATEGKIRHTAPPYPPWLVKLKPDIAAPPAAGPLENMNK